MIEARKQFEEYLWGIPIDYIDIINVSKAIKKINPAVKRQTANMWYREHLAMRSAIAHFNGEES